MWSSLIDPPLRLQNWDTLQASVLTEQQQKLAKSRAVYCQWLFSSFLISSLLVNDSLRPQKTQKAKRIFWRCGCHHKIIQQISPHGSGQTLASVSFVFCCQMLELKQPMCVYKPGIWLAVPQANDKFMWNESRSKRGCQGCLKHHSKLHTFNNTWFKNHPPRQQKAVSIHVLYNRWKEWSKLWSWSP